MTLTLAASEAAHLAGPSELLPIRPPPLTATITPLSEALGIPDRAGYNAIIEQARQLASNHSKSAVALGRLAQAEQHEGNLEEAVSAAQSALASARKGETGTIAAAIRVLISCGKAAEAERALDKLEFRGPWAPLYASLAIKRGDLDTALERLEECESIDALSLSAWLYLQTQQYGKAASVLRRALRQGPPSADILTNLAYALAVLGSRAKAIAVTRQARALAPASRAVWFNLANYYAGEGKYDTALGELRSLLRLYPRDLKTRFAIAEVFLQAGDRQRALRTLRSARKDFVAEASTSDRAELNANITFLEWQSGARERKATIEGLQNALEACSYQSLGITSMLCSVLSRISDASRLGRILTELRRVHDEKALLEPRVHLAFLRGDFASAAELAQVWVLSAPFDVGAAIKATYLVGDVRGDYAAAADLGLQTLKRVPASFELANNVAYALAMAGRPLEARQYIPVEDRDSPYVIATTALIDVLLGRYNEGLAGYARAQALAEKAGDTELAALLTLRRLLIERSLGKARGKLVDLIASTKLPDEWEQDPRFLVLISLAERELLLGNLEAMRTHSDTTRVGRSTVDEKPAVPRR
jgi:tetratricopeptide (TPR) repeat protein